MNRKAALLILTLAQLMVVMDSVIVNLALPAMKNALHFDAASLQWVLTAYILTFGGFLMLGGRVADLYGRRKIFIVGVAGFSFFSLLMGFTRSSTMLIGLRALEGLSGAFMAPASLSILLTIFEEGEERNWALSMWSIVISGGAAVGVILGGLLTEYVGWRWNFFINVPIGLAAIAGAMVWVPAHTQEASDKHLDLPGAVLVTAGLLALVYALTLASTAGWSAASTLVTLAASLVLLAGFIINETRAKHPLVPFSIFRIRNVSGGNLIMLPTVGGSLGMGYFTSLYIQNILHYSPALSGLSSLPIPIIIGVLSTRAPRLINRYGFKLPLVIGTAFMTLGVLLMAFVTLNSSYVTHLLPAFIAIAIGDGLAFVAGTVAATTGVRGDEAGLASGLVNTSEQVGGALGLAVLAAAASTVTATSLAAGQTVTQASLLGYREAFLYASGMLAIALVMAIFVIRTPKPVRRTESECGDQRAYGMDC